MGRYLDIVKEWQERNRRPQGIDGHDVAEIIIETPKMVIFRDPEGKVWRRVHSWRMTWPVVVEGKGRE